MSNSLRPHGRQASLSFTVSWSLLKLMSTESMMLSNHLYHFLLLMLSIFPSIRVFSSESALHIRWPKNWSFSFSSSPSNEYSGLISFRIDWLDLFAVWGTLKSLLQYHKLESINSSVLSLLYGPTLTSIHDLLVVKNLPVNAGITGSICVRKIPWSRKWQPTLVFLPGKFPGQRSLGGLQSMGSQRVWHN